MSLNITLVILAGIFVILMQAGLALLATGLCRAKNAAQVISMNLVLFPLSVLGFWASGFALMSGGGLGSTESSLTLFGRSFGILAHRGFFLHAVASDPAVLARFLFQAAAISIAAVIPVGVMAERWRFRSIVPYGLVCAAVPLAIFGNWVWGGGWLAQMGQHLGMGHGFIDFAGSSVVHVAGGVTGLMGATALGPRIGKYSRDGRPRPMPGHSLTYVVFGTLLLAAAWIGFNIGPALLDDGQRVPLIAVNTMLASCAGAVAAFGVVISKFHKPDPSMICNGLLAGLVAISASCPFVTPWGAVITGAIAGVLVVYGVLFFEGTMKLDDPTGALSVHGIAGAWGILSLGLLADGSYGAGINGVQTLARNGTEVGVAGILGGVFGSPMADWSQLGAQVVGLAVCVGFFGLAAWIWFKACRLIVPLRARHEDELTGLDLPEMGAESYPDFHLTDKGSSRAD